MQPTTTATSCPAGLHTARLPDTFSPLLAEARLFCLRTINEVYGIDHRPDWHADLDSLLGPANQYAARHAGAFWTVQDSRGTVVATAGLLHLSWKPAIPAAFPGRYPAGPDIGALGRVYVRRDWRGRGLGRHLVAVAEHHAATLGHATLYLHADAGTPATLAFWHATGFHPFASADGTTHFDKPVTPAWATAPRL